MRFRLDLRARRAVVSAAAVAAACAAGLIAPRTPAPALINESPSLPRGVYLRFGEATPGRGATVAVPQPPAARAYLAGLGMPGDVRLLKRVAAAAGDRVCRIDDRIAAGRRVVFARRKDHRGVPLPQWRGCRRLGPGEVFLLGDTPGSFDSRYFGPVRVADLDGVYREVLTW